MDWVVKYLYVWHSIKHYASLMDENEYWADLHGHADYLWLRMGPDERRLAKQLLAKLKVK